MTQLQRARLAVFVVFTIAGASVTTWAAHIPTVEKDLAISHAEIGTALLFFGGGAVLSMQVTGFLVDRIGSKGATLLALAALGIGVTTPGLATDLLSLSITLFIFGFGLGATDIAMNAHAVVVERVYNRPILSAFHAFWSIGGLLGAILGGTMVGLGVPMGVTLFGYGIATILLMTWLAGWLLPQQAIAESDAKRVSARAAEAQNGSAETAARPAGSASYDSEAIPAEPESNRGFLGLALFLGAMSASAAIAEGVGVDWSALHQSSVLGTSASQAAIAIAVYTGTMGLVRFFVDRVVARFGRIAVIRYGSALSAVGIAVVMFSQSPIVALLGWAISGVGIAGVIPQIFAVSANIGPASHHGRNLAKVVGITYGGVLAGPAIVGWLTNLVPLQFAIGTGVLLGLFTAIGTKFIPANQVKKSEVGV